MPVSYTTPGQVQLVGELPAGSANLLEQSYVVTNDAGGSSSGPARSVGIRVWNGTSFVLATLLNSVTGAVSLAGDVAGPTSANIVVSLSGNGGLITVFGPTFAWAGNVVLPKILQSPPAGAGNGQPLSITSQAGGTGTTTGGPLNLGAGAGNAGGLSGAVNIQWAGVTQFSFDPASSGLVLFQQNILWGPAAANPTISQTVSASGNGRNMTVQAQGGAAGGFGGALFLSSGAGNGQLDGNIIVRLGSTVVAVWSEDVTINGLKLSRPRVIFEGTVLAPVIGQIDPAQPSNNGEALTVQAQDGGPGATVGGVLSLVTGAGSGGGVPGTLIIRIGGPSSSDVVQIARAGGIVFSPLFPTPTIQQQSTAGAAADMQIIAQSTSLVGAQGASLKLRSGGGPVGSGFIQFFMGANSLPHFQLNLAGSWNIRSGSTATGHDWLVDWENLAPGQSVAGIDPIGIPVEVDGNPYMIPLYPQF